MTTTEERYKAAVAAIKAGGVTVRVNVRSATLGSVAVEQLGIKSTDAPYAFTWGGQGNAVHWRDDGEAYTGERYPTFRRRTKDRPWLATPENLARYRAIRIYWYHGGPAAQVIADAFRAQGFTVEWDGSAEKSVVVQMPVSLAEQA